VKQIGVFISCASIENKFSEIQSDCLNSVWRACPYPACCRTSHFNINILRLLLPLTVLGKHSPKDYQLTWDFKFSRRRVWCSELSSGLYCRVKWLSTDDPWWWRQYAPLNRRTTKFLHGSTTQKTALNIINSPLHIPLLCITSLRVSVFKPLKPKHVYIIINNSVRTSKRTPHFSIKSIKWLILFEEIIAVYTENHTKPINTKYTVTGCEDSWDV
jgi:hypothetical protein